MDYGDPATSNFNPSTMASTPPPTPKATKRRTEATFEPQPTHRISNPIEPDNDTWTEYLTIVDMLNAQTETYQLQIRSFFESAATGKKTWDEPPSGAKNIRWAGPTCRKMAEEQMGDMKIVGQGQGQGQKKRPWWRTKKKQWMASRSDKQEGKGASRISRFAYVQGSKTDDLLSTTDGNDGDVGGESNSVVAADGSIHERNHGDLQEEEAIAIATALSLSESDIRSGNDIGMVCNHGKELEELYEKEHRLEDRKMPAVPNGTVESRM